MADNNRINALIAAAGAYQAPSATSSAIVRAQKLRTIQVNIGSLMDSVINVEPGNLSGSSFCFDIGLTRTAKDDISSGLILIGPARSLDSGLFDDCTFGDLDEFIFFKVTNRSGVAMDCRYLGVEGSSHLVNLTGIAVGDVVTLAIPNFSLVCGRSMADIFVDILVREP